MGTEGPINRVELERLIEKFLEGKDLRDVKLKDAREHVELLTGVRPEKRAIMDIIMKISENNPRRTEAEEEVVEEEEEEEAEEEADEDDDEGDMDDDQVGGLYTTTDPQARVLGLRKKFWLSEPLIAVVGAPTATLHETLKAIVKHIRDHGLANPSDAKEIFCDGPLRNIFKRSKFDVSELRDMLRHEFENLTGAAEGETRVKKPAVNAKKKIKKKKKPRQEDARGGFGIEHVAVSPVLDEFLGGIDVTRPQVVKAIWKYIKDNNLQNPDNRREIHCDEALYKIFRRDVITMFSMNKYLTVHIKTKEQALNGEPFPLHLLDLTEEEFDRSRGPESKSKKRKREAKTVADQPKKKRGGFRARIPLSDELSHFMGGATDATRGEVVKQLWAYIKENNLVNPENKQQIICDDILRHLLGQEVVTQFSVNKYIQPHFLTKKNRREAEQNEEAHQQDMETSHEHIDHHHQLHHHHLHEDHLAEASEGVLQEHEHLPQDSEV